MFLDAMKNPFNIIDIFRLHKWKKIFADTHPNYFEPIGTMIFCGSQGKGKTLSAVCYVDNVLKSFPFSILVTNVAIKSRPFNVYYKVNKKGETDLFYLDSDLPLDFDLDFNGNRCYRQKNIVIEYDGLDCLKYIGNSWLGVIYLIDELHLELNSLESKNIDIDVMTEISQQRKQRKHIVGTSQVYMRLAKPLREQIFDVVLCNNFFHCIQFNRLIDGEQSKEENGKLNAVVRKRVLWIHKPSYYSNYDTFAKMKRYNKEWQGHKRETPVVLNSTIVRGDKK